MAGFCRNVGRRCLVLSKKLLSGNVLLNAECRLQGVRHLYAESALGIDNYVQTRERVAMQFSKMSESFKKKMEEFSDPESKNMIFTEDLKNMLHLVDSKSGDDVDLIMRMLKKFNSQNKELRFGSFVFGPVVMRTFYYLNQPVAAFEAFKTSELDGFFDQLGSYQILMDLLLKNKMYNEVIEAFNVIRAKQIQNARYPKNVVLLTLAACYKLNTPESFQLMTDLWKDLQTAGHIPVRRSFTFAAALALNQGAPHVALEILAGVNQQNYFTVQNLKAAALADIGRVEDALPILRSVLNVDDPSMKKHTITFDVLKKVKAAVEACDSKEVKYNFGVIEKQLEQQGHMTEQPLEEFLFAEISLVVPNQNRNQQFVAASFSQQNYNVRRQRQPLRPGLKDRY